jgi:hypothetical protein
MFHSKYSSMEVIHMLARSFSIQISFQNHPFEILLELASTASCNFCLSAWRWFLNKITTLAIFSLPLVTQGRPVFRLCSAKNGYMA